MIQNAEKQQNRVPYNFYVKLSFLLICLIK